MSGPLRAVFRLNQAVSQAKPFPHAWLQGQLHRSRPSVLSRSGFSTRSFSTIRPIIRRQRFRSGRANNTKFYSSGRPNLEAAQEKVKEKTLSASQRFKDLSRKYGWAAVGVYLGLSALDFPFCFLAVRMLGPERVGEAEHYVVSGFWNIVGKVMPSMKPKLEEATSIELESALSEAEHGSVVGASIWTQLLLAYGVHKSLIFFRVPLTAAVTPKVVKFLRARGWKIGNPKAT